VKVLTKIGGTIFIFAKVNEVNIGGD